MACVPGVAHGGTVGLRWLHTPLSTGLPFGIEMPRPSSGRAPNRQSSAGSTAHESVAAFGAPVFESELGSPTVVSGAALVRGGDLEVTDGAA